MSYLEARDRYDTRAWQVRGLYRVYRTHGYPGLRYAFGSGFSARLTKLLKVYKEDWANHHRPTVARY